MHNGLRLREWITGFCPHECLRCWQGRRRRLCVGQPPRRQQSLGHIRGKKKRGSESESDRIGASRLSATPRRQADDDGLLPVWLVPRGAAGCPTQPHADDPESRIDTNAFSAPDRRRSCVLCVRQTSGRSNRNIKATPRWVFRR
jgi:hypothetical protein